MVSLNLRGIKADALYVIRTWYRIPSTLILSFVIPIVLLVAFGMIFQTSEPAAPRIHVVDMDGSAQSHEFASLLGSLTSFQVTNGTIPAGADAGEWMQSQGIQGLVEVPSGFGKSLTEGNQSKVALRISGRTPLEVDVVRNGIDLALTRMGSNASAEPVGPQLVVNTGEVVPDLPYSSFLLPGVIGMTVLSTGLNMSFASVGQLREQGLLERLVVSPLTKHDWLIARMIGQSVMSMVIAAVTVLVAVVFFDTDLTMSYRTLLLIIAGTLVFAGLGAVLGGAVKKLETGSLILSLVVLPIVLFSGSFFSVSSLPPVLRWVSQVSPLTYLNDGLRADMVQADPGTAMFDVGILMAIALVVVLLGARAIDWTEKG